MDPITIFNLFFGFLFIILGVICLLMCILFHKKGKILIVPWRKTLYGRSASWWIERDNLDDWSLYWHSLIFSCIVSIVMIIIGFVFLLINYGLIKFPSS